MAELEFINNATKTLGKAKGLIPFAIAGAVLGVFALIKKGSTNQSLDTAPDGTEKVGENIGGLVTEQEAKFEQKLNSLNSTYANVIGDLYTDSQTQINALKQQLATDNTTISQQLSTLQTDTNNTISNLVTKVDTVTTGLDQTRNYVANHVTEVQKPVTTVEIPKPVVVNTTTPSVVKTAVDNISQTLINVTTGDQTKSYNIGNSGIGYDVNRSAGFELGLKINSDVYKKEMERVDKVIADRKELGLDTTLQESYKAKIQR